jgi:hypothetical protein
MAESQASSGMREQGDRRPVRRCAFCETPFTPRMEAWMGDPTPCACCGGRTLGHWPIKAPVRDTDELKCDACGKVLYRAG